MKNIPIIPEASDQLVMVGCSILRKEVDSLIKKHHWQIETHYLDAALHNYIDRLSIELNKALVEEEQKGKNTLVFYGACHPNMDKKIASHHTCRTQGQNCIVMLLGYEHFMRELSQGAFFLLEGWTQGWEEVLNDSFNGNLSIIREIFHSSHKYILALATPFSGDYTEAAEKAAAFVDLPLRWLDVDLHELEEVMIELLEEKLKALHA